jgi:nucleotide-binding universal stress UspA family protein
MITTIAVGTDGTETAAEALEMAAEMARRFEAKIVLLSAFDSSRASRSPTDPEGEWSYSPASRLQEILGRAEEDLRKEGLDASVRIEDGDPADVLVRLAGECDADVLVVGNKGMQRRVLGSVPNTVTHRADCSVLVVKTT